jgi:hypothetical protein
VTNSSGVFPWTLTIPAGSLQEWLFTFTIPSTGVPFPIVTAPWEYVVRSTATDLSSPLIYITTNASAQGQIVVTSTAQVSSAQVNLTPAATVGLAPGEYAHTLWMDPGTPSAYTWFTGNLLIVGNAQPG